MKKVLGFLTAFMVALSMAMPAFAAETAEGVKIKIVHTNDVHARVDGEAYVSSYVKGLKESGENVILISAGDVLHGQTLATISKGDSIVEIMNAAGYDYMAIGNHDFNYGSVRLKELVSKMNFEVLAANVVSADTKAALYDDCTIKEIDGVKVGIFGISTPETATKTNPKNVVGIEFSEPVDVSAKMVEKLKADGAEVIIAITHLGVDEETLPAERSTAVAAVAGIDIVIDGHSHTVLENGLQVEGGALIAQTGEYLNSIGVVELVVKDGAVASKTAKLITTPAEAATDWAPDQSIVDTITKIQTDNEVITSEVIGSTPIKLEGERENVRTKETNLANLISEAMIAATDSDICIQNGGGIRASVEPGDITMGDILTVLPFGNVLCSVEVTGAVVLEALEHGVDSYPNAAGHYSQIGGMSMEFDSSQPAGSRIVSVTLDDGSALDPAKTYKLVTNELIVAGGDNYSMLMTKNGYMEYGSLDECVVSYIRAGVDFETIRLGRTVDVAGAAATVQEPAATVEVPAEVVTATETPVEAEQPAAVEQPATTEQPAVSAGGSYTVVSGDYLIKIAEDNNTTWKILAELNDLSNPNLIYPGQVIVLP